MQVFLLSLDSEENAKFYVDKHVIKTPAVIVQLLLNALARNRMAFPQLKNFNGMPLIPKKEVLNHPLCRWTAARPANFDAMLEFGLDLCKEFRLRFHDRHFLEDSILAFDLQECGGHPSFNDYPWMIPLAFHDKINGLVESYRKYYQEAKNHLAFWSSPRDVPPWYSLEAVQEGRLIAQSFKEAKAVGIVEGFASSDVIPS